MYKKDRFACPFLFVHNPCQKFSCLPQTFTPQSRLCGDPVIGRCPKGGGREFPVRCDLSHLTSSLFHYSHNQCRGGSPRPPAGGETPPLQPFFGNQSYCRGGSPRPPALSLPLDSYPKQEGGPRQWWMRCRAKPVYSIPICKFTFTNQTYYCKIALFHL